VAVGQKQAPPLGEALQIASMHCTKRCSVKLGLAAMVGFEQRKEHVVPPRTAPTQIVAQQAFKTEPEFFDEPSRRGVVWMDESLHAMDAEFIKAEVEHRGDRLGRDSFSVVRGIDDVADRQPLMRRWPS
jgi:hypothetical protein